MTNRITNHKGISLLIKIAIVVACLYFIYHKIFSRHDLNSILSILKESSEKIVGFNLILLMVLMGCNWAIEAYKWKLLIFSIESISFVKSFKAVLAGLTVSIFTPNRAGEFAGRVFFLQKDNRLPSILPTVIGNAAQLIVTFIMGALATLFYLSHFSEINSVQSPYLFAALLIIIVIFIVFLLLTYFNLSFLISRILKIKMLVRFHKYFVVLANHSTKLLLKIFLWSFFRYVLFTVQFVILLISLDVKFELLAGLAMIALTFFAVTVIPTIAVTELGIRGSAALAFIGLLSENHVAIVAASFLLWVVNIAIPALIGSIFVFQMKFFNQST